MRPTCTPDDGLIQTLNFTNITNDYIYPTQEFTVGNYINFDIDKPRETELYLDYYKAKDIHISSSNPLFSVSGSSKDKIWIHGADIRNVSTYSPMFMFVLFKVADLEESTFSDIKGTRGSLLFFSTCRKVRPKGMRIINFENSDLSVNPVFDLDPKFGSFNIFNYLYIENATIHNVDFLHVRKKVAAVDLRSSTIKNMRFDASKSFIRMDRTSSYYIHSTDIINCSSVDGGESYFIKIREFKLRGDSRSDLKKLNFINSSLVMKSIGSVVGSDSVDHKMKIKKITYQD